MHTVFVEESQGNFISIILAIRNDLLQFEEEITGKSAKKCQINSRLVIICADLNPIDLLGALLFLNPLIFKSTL